MKTLFTTLIALLITGFVFGATFTSIASGNFTVAGTWSQSGVDADGIPDANDDVVISGGHSVTLVTTSDCRNLTINATGNILMNGNIMRNYGNLTNNGSMWGIGSWQFRAAGTYSGNPMNLQGSVYFLTTYTIAGGVNLTKNNGAIILGASVVVTNNGNVTLNHGGNGYIQFTNAVSQWINTSGSTLTVSANFVGSGILTATASGNTVTYRSNGTTSIKSTNYHHLILTGTTAHTKALLGNITVAGNLTIQPSVTFNWANFNITLAGNWTNNANTTCTNMGSMNFNSATTQSITRATGNTEVFNIVNLNGIGTVTLGDSLRTNGALNINTGELDVTTSNYNVHCRGTLNNSASFNTRQGTVFMDGSSAQTIDGFSLTVFYNLTANNAAGVTVNSAQQISNILYVAAGSFGPSVFGSLVLLATGSTTSARIAPLGATGSLVGTNWTIQTWIDGPATAYWQYLGSPTTSSTLADWDGDPRFYMSGVGGNDGNACCPIFRSVRVYNEPTNTYTNITTTAQALTPGQGFMVWMSDNLSGLTSPLVYDTRGTPNFGGVSRAVTSGGAGGGYNLVSNPYACPVTYSTVVANSDAVLNPSFLILTESGSYATDPNGGTIAAGQGFLCIATVSGDVVFTETAKSTTANPNVIRAMAGNQIRIKAGNEVSGLGEETIIRLNPVGDASYDAVVDMPYIATPYDNATHIWSQNEFGAQFILNDIGTSDDHLMIPVSVVSSTPGVQSLTFKDLNTVTEYNCAWLEDLTTGERINLNAVDTYTYTEEELGITRNFLLHFERNNDCSFDLQQSAASLEAQTNVYVNSGQVYAGFEFETEEVVTVSMYDISGRIIMGETTMNVGTQTVSLTNPDAHGIYLVRIAKGTEVVTKKFYY